MTDGKCRATTRTTKLAHLPPRPAKLATDKLI